MSTQPKIGRREFIQRSGKFAGGLLLGSALPAPALAAGNKRLKVGAVITAFTYRSHAHVILENFLEPYLFNGRRTSPGVDVVSFYGDQFPPGEMARDIDLKPGSHVSAVQSERKERNHNLRQTGQRAMWPHLATKEATVAILIFPQVSPQQYLIEKR